MSILSGLFYAGLILGYGQELSTVSYTVYLKCHSINCHNLFDWMIYFLCTAAINHSTICIFWGPEKYRVHVSSFRVMYIGKNTRSNQVFSTIPCCCHNPYSVTNHLYWIQQGITLPRGGISFRPFLSRCPLFRCVQSRVLRYYPIENSSHWRSTFPKILRFPYRFDCGVRG